MAGNIKGITIEFQGDASKLQQSIRDVENSTRKIDAELKKVNTALKFNPTNVDLWRQKQELLTQKINDTEKKLSLLKQQQADMDAKGVDKNSKEYRELQREIIATESKVKTFRGQLKSIGNVKLKALSEQFKSMGGKLEAAGQKMKGLSKAAAGVVAGLGAVAYKAGQNADDLNTLSKVYGIGTKNLQKYKAAADLVDVSVETIAKTQTTLKKKMYAAQNGSKSAAEMFDKLGVSVTDSDGNLRDSEAVWEDAISALGQMKNESERSALGMQLMGRSAQELNPLIKDGGETYKNVSETLKKYDLGFIDQDTLDKANQFNDQLDTMKLIGSAALSEVGAKIAEAFAPAMEKLVDLIGRLAGWLSSLSPEALAIIGTIAAVVAAVAPVLIVIGKLATGIGSIISLVGMLPAGFMALAGPIGIAIAILGALAVAGTLLYKNWDKIKAFAKALAKSLVLHFQNMKKKLSTILTSVKTYFATIWSSIKTKTVGFVTSIKDGIISKFTAIKDKAKAIFDGVKEAITHPIQTAKDLISKAIDKIKSIISGAKLALPKFKLPHFKINGGKLPWGIGGKGVAPSINVDWYAKGGIFNSPSLIGVGEAGSEAVVPLDKFWSKLDRIADAQRGGAIVVNVYGSDGMSVNELAAAVQKKLIETERRRKLAWQ